MPDRGRTKPSAGAEVKMPPSHPVALVDFDPLPASLRVPMPRATAHSLLAAVDDKAPPHWIAAGLALLCHAEDDPTEVALVLADVVIDRQRPLALRLEVARACGDIVAAETLRELAGLVTDEPALQAALAAAEHEQQQHVLA